MKRKGKMNHRTGILLLAFLVVGCQSLTDELVGNKPEDARSINITMIAKSATNPVFQSARIGAESAAEDLSDKYSKIDVKVDWRTPRSDDPKEQAERIQTAVEDGTDAILVSCSDEAMLTSAINMAVDQGIPVMTFDSDAPDSKRFAFYGPDDVAIGERVITELVQVMGESGKIAVLGGIKTAPNLQKRVEGVRKAAAEYPALEIVGEFYHLETAEAAAAKVLEVMTLHPDLDGWAMVGGWPFFTDSLLDSLDPEAQSIVAVDALPVMLPYVEAGIVDVFLGQPTFKWGDIPVRKVIDKLHLEKDVDEINPMKLIPVSKANLGGWSRQLRAWGYHDVPEKYLTL